MRTVLCSRLMVSPAAGRPKGPGKVSVMNVRWMHSVYAQVYM